MQRPLASARFCLVGRTSDKYDPHIASAFVPVRITVMRPTKGSFVIPTYAERDRYRTRKLPAFFSSYVGKCSAGM
jgi:hypothetical protein